MKKRLLFGLMLGLCVAVVFAIGNGSPLSPNPEPLTPKPDPMILNGGGDHAETWKKVDSLDRKGLPKDAQKLIDSLYLVVKKEGNTNQLVKTVIYRQKYLSLLEEEGLMKAIMNFEKEANEVPSPTKEILLSATAEAYNQYLNQNMWKFNERTATAETFKPEDLTTWELDRIHRKISELYHASLANPDCRTVKLADLSTIIYPGDEIGTKAVDNLQDFLVWRALNFFMDTKTYLNEPAYKFEIEDEQAFGSAAEFVKHKFVSKDSTGDRYQTVLLLQSFTRSHMNDKEASALEDIDLRRIAFMNSTAVMSNKKELYIKAIEREMRRTADRPVHTEWAYLMAAHHYNLGATYNRSAKNDPNRLEYRTAYKIADEAAKKFPNSLGAGSCKSLMLSLENKSLTTNVEKVNALNTPILVSVSYRNISKVYHRLIRLTDEQYLELSRTYNESQLAYLTSLPTVEAWNTPLEDDGDYQDHNTEIKVNGQKQAGYYVLLSSANEKFDYNGNGVAFAKFYISNIAFNQRNQNGFVEFYLTDRLSGKPLVNAKAEVWVQVYNETKRAYEYKLSQTLFSDAEGYVKVLGKDNSFEMKFYNGKDFLCLNDASFYAYSERDEYYDSQTTSFFLDRAIYRPGQTIYFKGLVLNQRRDKYTIAKPSTHQLALYDANYQEVAKLTLISNEYGTFNGVFTAPTGGITGQMHIQDNTNGASHYFRVEEYKRPKFEVSFDPIKESYKPNEVVTVKGVAKAYAGSNIDGAKVKYRVVRQTSFPYWRWWDWGWYIPYNQSPDEIAHGDAVTDAEGKFDIKFTALPDRSVDAKYKPSFSYQVYADVTDMAGETRSGSQSLSVGYVALVADIAVEEMMNRDSLKQFSITASNLNGQPEPAQGTVKVEKLVAPKTTYRNRLWAIPVDRPSIPEVEFKKLFPSMPYKNEQEISTWAVEKAVMTANFDTKDNSLVKITDRAAFVGGAYKVTMKTKDKYGEAIEIVKYMTLYDTKSKSAPANTPLFINVAKYSYEPGETAEIYVGSSYEGASVLYEVEHEGKLSAKRWIKLNGMTRITIPVEEKHRGNFHVHFMMMNDGRAYVQDATITVPWTNKELKIEYSTFRDKLLPGQDEEWRVKISGMKGDKVAAELLAAMYDASLDEFASNDWFLSLNGYDYPRLSWQAGTNYTYAQSYLLGTGWNNYLSAGSRAYPGFNWFGFSFYNYNNGYYYNRRGGYDLMESDGVAMSMAPAPTMKAEESARGDSMKKAKMPSESRKEAAMEMAADEAPMQQALVGTKDPAKKPDGGGGGFGDVKVRTNLNETVFFFPDLMTDADGNVIIKFKMNEALTRWKFMALAHTKDLKIGQSQRFVVTQKDLMVMPNAPRFLRDNDDIEFSAKVSNLTKDEMIGEAKLEFYDAITMKPIDALVGNNNAVISFTAKAGQSAPLVWKLKIPDGGLSAVTYRVIAKSGAFSDGEESSLPVVTNRMLVTETMPLPIRGGQTKDFEFKRMSEVSKSTTMKQHKLTLEFTANPAWYAVQALPYLMEYPYECTEQVFSRFYANALATTVANSHPKIKQVFDTWKNFQPDALKSNLSKNQELKYALLEETPWVLAAQSEEVQKKNIGLLFDLNRMSKELKSAMDKMTERQLSNGGFTWFPGMPDNQYITQYLVEGFGHMDRLGVKVFQDYPNLKNMVTRAVQYCDDRIVEQYNEMIRLKYNMDSDNLGWYAMHYVYARSFYLTDGGGHVYLPLAGEAKKVYDYYMGQAEKYWLSKGYYGEGLLALASHRYGKTKLAQDIVKSLRQNALNNEEFGMYWKYPSGYSWYQMPIETHAVMIEVFDEVANDAQAVDDLKTYLIKNKQTTSWSTTKATASATYALLLRGDNWLLEDKDINITLGNTLLDQSKIQKEAGTGYFKTTWEPADIKPEMAKVKIENPNKNVAWGAMYWQYFEQLDKITFFKETPLKLNKQLFRQDITDKGPLLTPINEKTELHVGDLVKVRIELFVDRDMEYVQLKDMRASCFEPTNVLSQYKYQGGLGYYESTRDLSTSFFIGYLSKGSYVFEYPLRVTHRGDFSNGITTIQCMYAPEFTSHSTGIRVQVK